MDSLFSDISPSPLTNTIQKAVFLMNAHQLYKYGLLGRTTYDLIVKGLTMSADSLRAYINYAYL